MAQHMLMAVKRYDKRLNVLVTSEEHRMLSDLAERQGLAPSDVVRQLVRREHATVFGEPPLRPTKVPKRK
jgi:DNA-binding MarR family transcriptional regulator